MRPYKTMATIGYVPYVYGDEHAHPTPMVLFFSRFARVMLSRFSRFHTCNFYGRLLLCMELFPGEKSPRNDFLGLNIALSLFAYSIAVK